MKSGKHGPGPEAEVSAQLSTYRYPAEGRVWALFTRMSSKHYFCQAVGSCRTTTVCGCASLKLTEAAALAASIIVKNLQASLALNS